MSPERIAMIDCMNFNGILHCIQHAHQVISFWETVGRVRDNDDAFGELFKEALECSINFCSGVKRCGILP